MALSLPSRRRPSINVFTVEHCESSGLGPVSRKSRELFGPEKPFVKLRPAYSLKLVFSYVVKGIKIKISFVPRDDFVLKIQRELCHPKYARKVSGLSRNRPLASET